MPRRLLAVLRKALPWVVPLAVVATAVYFRRFAPVEVEAHRVDRGEVVAEVLGTGTLESAVVATPGFPTAGRITSLAVDEGDRVRAGQVLATLDVTDARQQLLVTRANEEVAQAAVARAMAEYERASTLLAQARIDRERARKLFAGQAIPATELEAAEEKFATAEADVRAAAAAKVLAERAGASAHRSVSRDAYRLADLQLASPFDGIVVRKQREVGDVLPPGQPVYTVAAVDRLWARVWVDETALGTLKLGQPARIELRSEPGRFYRGHVLRIGKQADRQTHELLVDVQVDELPQTFALGQRADAYLISEARPDRVRVPRGYCDPGTRTCLVQREGRAARVPIELGLSGRSTLEVTRGLAPGDLVIRPSRSDVTVEQGRQVRVGRAL